MSGGPRGSPEYRSVTKLHFPFLTFGSVSSDLGEGLSPSSVVLTPAFSENIAQPWASARTCAACPPTSHPILTPRLCYCPSDAGWDSASYPRDPSEATITDPLTSTSLVWEAVIIITPPLGCGLQPGWTLHSPHNLRPYIWGLLTRPAKAGQDAHLPFPSVTHAHFPLPFPHSSWIRKPPSFHGME